jgi:hypothetical protein
LGWICQVASCIRTREPNSKVTFVNPANIIGNGEWSMVNN